jgi:hypothetical protein
LNVRSKPHKIMHVLSVMGYFAFISESQFSKAQTESAERVAQPMRNSDAY